MHSELPRGTVTFLFTDIEGSTRLLHELGADRYADALAEHRGVLRTVFAAHGGVEVDTQGDAFFVAFPTAPGAAAAANAAQAALLTGPIRVRMGLHTGTPTVTDEGYVGVDVHHAARIAALAHGGQVLLSEATHALLPADANVLDLGTHRIRDFDAATRLCQLGTAPFPPLRSPGAIALPTPATRFVGRRDELADAVAVWIERAPRVLTIVGPGGTGKTRFAIELARQLAEEADGGTTFVSLAAVRDPRLILPAIGERLEVAPEPARIAAHLRDRRTHVVLDNLEQLLPAAAAPLAELVEAAPALRLLVTSREPLRIAAETEFQLAPLAEQDAVELFLERAHAVRPDLANSESVHELVRRLDGLPLALELAAARLKLLDPEQLLERLGQRLDLFRAGRDADERHATLRATIAWSHDLLDDDERTLFARLAVFAAGCSLEAAEEVCDADLDTLSSLLDKSLVRRRDTPAGPRFWMLETIRSFALERLAEIDERERRERHARWMLELVRSAKLEFSLGEQEQRHEIVLAEIADVRNALDWAAEADPVLEARLLVGLEHLWATHAPGEGLRRAESVLAKGDAVPKELRAIAFRIQGGTRLLDGGTYEDRDESYERALALFTELDDRPAQAALVTRFAVHAGVRGDALECRRLIDEAQALLGDIDAPVLEAQQLAALGHLAQIEGDLPSAADLYRRSADTAAACGFRLWETWARADLADALLELGDPSSALAAARAGLHVSWAMRDRRVVLGLLAVAARASLALGDNRSAGRMWGAVRAEQEREPVAGLWSAPLGDGVPPGPEFASALAEGSELPLDEVVEELLQTEP